MPLGHAFAITDCSVRHKEIEGGNRGKAKAVRPRLALPIELHGDSDRAWTITGRGDDMLPKKLAKYMANEEAVVVRLSASGAHGRCPAESAMGWVLNPTSANQLRGHLAPSAWSDMMRDAANQVKDQSADQPTHGRRPGKAAWGAAEAVARRRWRRRAGRARVGRPPPRWRRRRRWW